MAGGGQPRAGPAQEGSAEEQDAALPQRQARQGEAAAIQRRHRPYRRAEQQQPEADDEQGDQGAGEPVTQAEIEKRPPDERVRPADELRNLDFDAAVVDLEPDGVADDDRDGEAQEDGREIDEPARERQHRSQPRDPRRVDLHELGFRERGHGVRRALRRPRRCRSPGGPRACAASGLPSSASSASPNPDCARNSASAASRSMRVTPATSSRSSMRAGRALRSVLGDVHLQVDREVRGALPRVADGVGVVDGDAQARRAARAPWR